MKAKKENFSIRIGDRFPVDAALRKFKRLADAYGVTKMYKAKEAFSKPSIRDKEKREAAEKRRKKAELKSGNSRRKI